MNKQLINLSINLFISLLLTCSTLAAQESNTALRQRILLDKDWRFAFGHPYDTDRDFEHATSYFSYLAKAVYGDGAASAKFDDRSWRQLDLPHDWAVEQDFSEKASFSHGFKAIGLQFPEATIGWYRKSFTIPEADLGRQISLDFDGVFRNSAVWVNGHYLGTEASGYNSFNYDITDVLNYGGDNTIAVRVDVGMEEGWFYEGAGIYRHVWLSKTDPIHVAKDGTFVSTDINLENNSATVNVKTELVNTLHKEQTISVVHTLVDALGKTIVTSRKDDVRIKPFHPEPVDVNFPVENITLWDLDTPYLYKLVTTVWANDKQTDHYETTFGFRTIRFDAKNGFFLNEKNIKLKGTNNHQDHAGVGAAMPDELQYYRIKALKDFGSNAYRASHNPPTPELLEACDRLGMLVIDENRLLASSQPLLANLTKMIKRDRNHPSIILWSVGNEEWGIENNVTGSRLATTLQAVAKSLDPTRPTTAGVSGGFKSGISDVLEVMGYNYIANGDIDDHVRRFPNQPGLGSEEGSTFATRGIYQTDAQKHYIAAYDAKPRPSFYSIEEGWKFYSSRPHLAGMFIWTGFDYRGEPTPHGWPSVTSYFGMMDLCGFPKDNVYYLKSWWTQTPTLHILPHWNWQGKEGEDVDVWVYSNCDEVELFLNKKSLGRQTMEVNSHLEWKVKYAAGTLQAIGYKDGKEVMHEQVKTTGKPVAIKLQGHQESIRANDEDILMVRVSAQDIGKLDVPTADNEISFTLEGPARIIGVGNGDPTSLEKERFVEDIQTVKINNLKEKELNTLAEGRSLLRTDGSSWKNAFVSRDYKNLAKAYIHRGTFELPVDLKSQRLTLFFNSIGKEQSIFINGTQVDVTLNDDKTAFAIALNNSVVKAGENQIDIIAKPLTKQNDWDSVNMDPGVIQLFGEAGQWKRKLFSGLAQIIIQATGQPGIITLSASSPSLETGKLTINSTEATIRKK
ncbi:beta-galactosidase GalA [Sphingobacterium chungjuense]|uniref:beta-galactosidase GalA n=1 Tax=Sphingobacterium chungjuense TaxID=2675553 RepID=UPI00140AAD3A|nr:beta-galactosidase GalA [Sphingobacterium chungjuense]